MKTLTVEQADKIIARYQSSPPVNVVAIAGDLGVKVYRLSNMHDSISGMIRRDKVRGGESEYAIFVNAEHSELRRRFTIAHEIAHFILHRDLIGDGIQDDVLYRSGLSGTIERQANKYAADILMPWDLVNAAVSRGNDSVEELAKIFQVSKSAMSIRLGVPYEKS